MSYAPTILADMPQGYYRLNEAPTTNVALDSTGHGYHATLSGSFAQGYAGALANERSTTSTHFDGVSGTMTLPPSLNDTTFTSISLEFWINVSGGTTWHYVVVTCDNHTTIVYLDASVTSTSSSGAPVGIGGLFDVAGSFQSGQLQEVALYNYVLSPAKISAHYLAAGTSSSSSSSSTVVTTPTSPPAVLFTASPVFGIGTYQSLTGGTTYAEGNPTTFTGVRHPWAGTYGGTYGFLLDTTIRTPQQTTYTPASEIGLDSTGLSVVRGYPSILWSYTTMRPDFWYYLKWVYWQSAMHTPPPFQYLVLIQYPDITGTNVSVQALARMDPPTATNRDVGAFYGVNLKFTYVGQSVLTPGVLIQVK